ncbi:hypothetical protein COCOBI_08-0770 [Coccomyxa sp. Obi]|nr:hypothetical protein COCOBI_08-0770 [Coccomyxa sp. Obi]
MDVDADENAAPSSSERVHRHLETRVPECYLSILGRALLINSLGGANEAQITGLLTLSPLGVACAANQCSAEAVPEWQYVGSLEVELRRNWLLFDTHLADLHLDLFSERGATRPPMYFGRVYVPEVEEIMWPPWIRAFSTPASTDTVTLRTRLLQLPVAVREIRFNQSFQSF